MVHTAQVAILARFRRVTEFSFIRTDIAATTTATAAAATAAATTAWNHLSAYFYVVVACDSVGDYQYILFANLAKPRGIVRRKETIHAFLVEEIPI